VSTGFIIVKSAADAVARLRTSFPDLWNDLLERADPDAPYLLYFALADLLVERRDNADLWRRAYRFFDEIAEGCDATAHDVLAEAFDRLCDSDMRDGVENHLGSAAKALYQRSKL
jgi:hypothetical protein